MQIVSEYAGCYNLYLCRLCWKRITPTREEILLDLYHECDDCKSLRAASRRIARQYHVSYRRLEDTAKHLDLLNYRSRAWMKGDKLVELTIYITYRCGRPKNWRDIEVRLYLGLDIDIPEEELLEYGPAFWVTTASDYIYQYDQGYGNYIEMLYNGAVNCEKEKGEEAVKLGVRLITTDIMECRLKPWCNKAYRVWVRHNEQIVFATLYDFRGYYRTFGDVVCSVSPPKSYIRYYRHYPGVI